MKASLLAITNKSQAQIIPPPIQLGDGIGGYTSTSGNFKTSYSQNAAWAGRIKGNSATMIVTGNAEVSIDNDVFVSVSGNGAVQLFSGLADTFHTVCVRPANGSSLTWGNINSSVVTASGSSPQVIPVSSWITVGDDNPYGIYCTETYPHGFGSYLPSRIAYSFSNVYGSNICSVRCRANLSGLIVIGGSKYIYVSIDGVTTRYDTGIANGPIRAQYVAVTPGIHDINAWNSRSQNDTNPTFALGIIGTLVSSMTLHRMLQFGDSITEGNGNEEWGCVDVFRAAALLGYCGGTSGVSGNTAALLLARLPIVLDQYPLITSSDVAIIAVGDNDFGFDWTTVIQPNYVSIINMLFAKGFGKILCRTPMPRALGDSNYNPVRAGIASMVTSMANPKVKFVDTSGWPITISQHPNIDEYASIATYAASSYGALL